MKIRIGIVLSEKGGALVPMARAAKSLVGAPLGSGNQFMSWIHIDDLCGIILKAITDNQLNGVYNAVSSTPVTNTEFMGSLAEALNKPVISPKVPAFVLKAMFGEMSTVVLDGARVSNEKILNTGFRFRFESLRQAFNDLLKDQ